MSNNNISIHPNPARNYLLIESPFDQFQVALKDVNGRQILSTDSFAPTFELNLPDLPKGMYFIQLQNMLDGQSLIKKVLIQ